MAQIQSPFPCLAPMLKRSTGLSAGAVSLCCYFSTVHRCRRKYRGGKLLTYAVSRVLTVIFLCRSDITGSHLCLSLTLHDCSIRGAALGGLLRQRAALQSYVVQIAREVSPVRSMCASGLKSRCVQPWHAPGCIWAGGPCRGRHRPCPLAPTTPLAVVVVRGLFLGAPIRPSRIRRTPTRPMWRQALPMMQRLHPAAILTASGVFAPDPMRLFPAHSSSRSRYRSQCSTTPFRPWGTLQGSHTSLNCANQPARIIEDVLARPFPRVSA